MINYARRITQHTRFGYALPFGTLPSATSFIRNTLGENLCPINIKENH